jgi:DNA-directed RNA polymerase specialized sigma24 family protein
MGFDNDEILAAANGDFTTLIRKRSEDFDKLTNYIAKRWVRPCWVDREDIRQEVLLGAWLAARRFDPTRGVPAARHMTYNAFDRGKKQLHKWRAARGSRNRDAGSSTLESRISTHTELNMMRIDDARFEKFEIVSDAVQECGNDEAEALVVRALAMRGTIRGAAWMLYRDKAVRLKFQFVSPADAREVVRKIALQIAARRGSPVAA